MGYSSYRGILAYIKQELLQDDSYYILHVTWTPKWSITDHFEGDTYSPVSDLSKFTQTVPSAV